MPVGTYRTVSTVSTVVLHSKVVLSVGKSRSNIHSAKGLFGCVTGISLCGKTTANLWRYCGTLLGGGGPSRAG